MPGMNTPVYLQCMAPTCGATFEIDAMHYACPHCAALLDVRYEWSRLSVPKSLTEFDARHAASANDTESRLNASGVWRFRDMLPVAPDEELVTLGEGRTHLQQADELARAVGMRAGNLFLQYEGFNPSGSFKDNGMAVAFTVARRLDRSTVACASTGNTSASLALYAAHTHTRSGRPMHAVVFVGGGKIAPGKLAQALDHGAVTLEIDGDFDACMKLIQQSAAQLDLYVMNSVNPFRLEGQKTIMYRVLEALRWNVPDWIVVPGGNLGNSSAFGKAFMELLELGLIPRMPRLAIINAHGANTLCELVNEHSLRFRGGHVDHPSIDTYFAHWNAEGRRAHTIASAIEIGRPVNLPKALRSLEAMNGVVRDVPDQAILDAKAMVGRFGFGCEPASAASVAGLQRLLREQIVSPSDRVACILTGHALKDAPATIAYHLERGAREGSSPHANPPRKVAANLGAIERALAEVLV